LPEPTADADTAVPDRLVLAIGDRFPLRLPGLASAGYEWTASVVGPQTEHGSVVSVELTVIQDQDEEDQGDATSYSLPVEATIVAIEPGQALVRLTLARSWQSPPPLRRHDIEVTVSRA
jgi:predicted secreted protein